MTETSSTEIAVRSETDSELTLPRDEDERSDDESRDRGLGLLFDMDRVLALGLAASASATDELDGDDQRLFDERLAARRSGDYARSDELRKALEARGIKVKDTKDGARWERIKEGSAR